jgi:heavy metal translocating P-type ATPase
MLVEVRHFFPGRIRLFVPGLFSNGYSGQSIESLLPAPAFQKIKANRHCASIVIEYDRNRPGIIADLMIRLRRARAPEDLIDNALTGNNSVALRDGAAAATVTAPAKQYVYPTFPLTLPTASLILSFFAGPIVIAINIPLMLWNARPIGRRTWKVLRHERRLNVDFLDTLAISVSMLHGAFLTAGIIVWLVRLGDWIRDLTAARSKRAVGELLEFQTRMAWVLRGGEIHAIPASMIVVGDTVVAHSGEMIPVDGEILTGCGTLDQKTITGESLPVPRGPGEAVYAATGLREGYLTIRAIRVGNDTTAAQIVHLVESAPVGETRIQNHAERFADRLVGPTLTLAAGMGIGFADVNRFTSLVIVDYGTGIRVAAPTSVLASMTHAARQGILIKSGAHLEKLAEVDTIVFDKTGTLTAGVPHVHDVISYKAKLFPVRKILGLAAAAEARLQHPVAEAIRARTEKDEIEVPDCNEVNYRIGFGVEARVNGYQLHLGSERFLRENSIATKRGWKDQTELNEHGCSSLFLAIDGALVGLIPYSDRVRPESRDVIGILHNIRIKDTIMLTGDNGTVARAVAERLGLSRYVADTLPADKAEYVRQLRREGRTVAMVGDGINDSPALSYADVGIAMKHGAQVAHESANIVLMEDNLWKLVKAIEISREGVALIKQNYKIVAVMNTAALLLALPGGLITPQLTAIISNGSAVIASLNAIRPTLRY